MESSDPISKVKVLFFVVVSHSLSGLSKKFVSILGADNFLYIKICIYATIS